MTKDLIQVPLLPLRGLLVFPTMVIHLDVGRDKSVQALEKAMMDDQTIFLAAQKKVSLDEPETKDIYQIGTLVKVKQTLKLPNGTIRVLVEGLHRGEIVRFIETENEFVVEIEKLEDIHGDNHEEEALMRSLLNQFEQYIKVSRKVTEDTLATVADIEEPGRLADIIASYLSLKVKEKQEILEIQDVKKRIKKLMLHCKM
ncbi:LON peptidase substrate-binding domain-containing protein, partial [Oceanobacillus caeni]|uniref:LON peptidase substrate-binding domain-containing protein n=1 Tax=Oceanobacillus caeni TaxID=405946 RepID=UPI002E22954B|nr:LON peptidase substrate-binding domain-containing protein [Oceanobacillus caeni]